jgi:hypothetical protein
MAPDIGPCETDRSESILLYAHPTFGPHEFLELTVASHLLISMSCLCCLVNASAREAASASMPEAKGEGDLRSVAEIQVEIMPSTPSFLFPGGTLCNFTLCNSQLHF